MSRPTNRRTTEDPMLLKADLIQHHAYGVRLYTVFENFARNKGKRMPVWNELNDLNVLKSIREADQFWGPSGYTEELVVQTYMKEFIGAAAMLRFQSLTGKGKDSLKSKIFRDQNSASAAIRGTTLISEADAACQNLVHEADVELALDYARGILKAQTGQRSMTEAGVQVMLSPIGNIQAWVRCFMTGNHPQVLELYGGEACGQFKSQPNLKVYLTRYNYDASPVMKLTPIYP